MLTTAGVFFLWEIQAIQKLVLHFDVNKTIIATDSVQNKGLAQAINGILAENTFYPWNGTDQESYYSYVTREIAKNNPNLHPASPEFKSKRSQLISGFLEYITQYQPLWFQCLNEKVRMLQLLRAKELVVFPSFFNLINWLDTHFKDRYVIYLRTFGTDLPEIMPIIEQYTSLKFAGMGTFEGRYLDVASQYSSLAEFFYASNKHYALQDDYAHWQAAGFSAIAGKLFPINTYNSDILTMFFDDNANDQDKPIISPIFHNGELLNTQELIRSGHIVSVNTKEAILNPDYFIEKVQKMVTN